MQRPPYLALDQAPRLIGWALGDVDMLAPLTGVLSIGKRSVDPADMVITTRDWVKDQIQCYRVSKVIAEQPFYAANMASFALACEQLGVIRLVCAKMQVELVTVPPNEWRMRFLGVCRAPAGIDKNKRRDWLKGQAIRACYLRKWDVKSHDEADACGILEWALSSDFKGFGTTIGAPLLA